MRFRPLSHLPANKIIQSNELTKIKYLEISVGLISIARAGVEPTSLDHESKDLPLVDLAIKIITT